jgi:hypothetical protein
MLVKRVREQLTRQPVGRSIRFKEDDWGHYWGQPSRGIVRDNSGMDAAASLIRKKRPGPPGPVA